MADNQKIILYATTWCYQSRSTRAFLDQHSIPYQFIDIDKDKEGEEFVLKTNRGHRSVPTLVFNDGSTMTEPSQQDLIHKLNL